MKLPFKSVCAKLWILGMVAGLLIIGTTAKMQGELQAVFLEKEVNERHPKLLAPEREVRKVHKDEKVCYLTFDDGPSENTEKILDILKQYRIKATFFVVGEEVRKDREKILKRMIEEGHEVGMHADVHVYENLYSGMESFLTDYENLFETLKETVNVEPSIFRFPGGSVCNCLGGQGKAYIREMEKRGFTCFDWNVSGEDAVGTPTAASIQKNVLSKGLECRRAIVLLHDSAMADKTVEALPGIIERFLEEGFVFASLEHAQGYVFPASRE